MIGLLLGIVTVAAVSTLGDYIWFEHGVRHRMLVGVLHGAALLAAVGGVVGHASGRILAGIPVGAAAGIGGALIYYGIVSMGGRGEMTSAMVAAWAAVWLILAALDGRVLRRVAPRGWPEIVGRGLVAAVLGGAAFYFTVDIIWSHLPPGQRNYVTQFGWWLVAWAPGILALTVPASGAASRR
jgi:hypothetical protein